MMNKSIKMEPETSTQKWIHNQIKKREEKLAGWNHIRPFINPILTKYNVY